MTYQSSQIIVDASLSDEDQFAIDRSKLLDEFARFETVVCKALNHFGIPADSRKISFACRLKNLSGAKASPSLSKKHAAKVKEFPDKCVAELEFRNSIVHSIMTIGRRGNEPSAIFQNVADVADGKPVCLILSRADFRRRQDAVRALHQELQSYLTPSSPPPPTPA